MFNNSNPSIYSVLASILFLGAATAGVKRINQGCKELKLIKTFHAYSANLANDSELSLDHLAATIGKPVTVVTQSIRDMIDYGLFPNCILDEGTNRLVVQEPEESENPPKPSQEAITHISVRCKSCGGISRIPAGTIGQCEYCDSPLSQK